MRSADKIKPTKTSLYQIKNNAKGIIEYFTNIPKYISDNIKKDKLISVEDSSSKILYLIDSKNYKILNGIFILKSKSNCLKKLFHNLICNSTNGIKIPNFIPLASVKSLYTFSVEDGLFSLAYSSNENESINTMILLNKCEAFSIDI